MGVRIPPRLPDRETHEGLDFLTRLREFFQEVTAEFRRVNWPSRQEVAASTVVVLVVVLVLSMYLGAVDVALSRLVEVILK